MSGGPPHETMLNGNLYILHIFLIILYFVNEHTKLLLNCANTKNLWSSEQYDCEL